MSTETETDNPLLEVLDRYREAVTEVRQTAKQLREDAGTAGGRWDQRLRTMDQAAEKALQAAQEAQEARSAAAGAARRWRLYAALTGLLVAFLAGAGVGVYLAPITGPRPVSQWTCELAGGTWTNSSGRDVCVFWAPR